MRKLAVLSLALFLPLLMLENAEEAQDGVDALLHTVDFGLYFFSGNGGVVLFGGKALVILYHDLWLDIDHRVEDKGAVFLHFVEAE